MADSLRWQLSFRQTALDTDLPSVSAGLCVYLDIDVDMVMADGGQVLKLSQMIQEAFGQKGVEH